MPDAFLVCSKERGLFMLLHTPIEHLKTSMKPRYQ